MDSLGQISSAAIQQYLAHAEHIGLDTAALIRLAGLDELALQQAETRIDGHDFQRLLHAIITQSQDPLFGLHTSDFIQPGSYNVIGYIAMSASSLLEVLGKVSLYEKLVGDMGTTDTQINGDQAKITWHCRYQDQPARQHLIDNILSSWLCYARWLTGKDDLCPTEVRLEHPAPSALLQEQYQAVFRCPVRFGCNESALIGHAELLSMSVKQPDPILLSTLEAHAIQQLNQLGLTSSLSDQVRKAIHDAIGHTLPRKEAVAETLGINVRTLHRRLAEEGHSWQRLLDDVRLGQARHLLRTTTQPQAEIAEALGYSDIRSFQRSFKRHTGITPGQFRSNEDN